ncbi:hypothetical protein PMI34_03819 [Pseudomonas sp. GM74]|nr:hypothetical protein PMI34_03819 [Pseudomonas sp. GM74]
MFFFSGHDSINQNFQFASYFNPTFCIRLALQDPDLVVSDIPFVQ